MRRHRPEAQRRTLSGGVDTRDERATGRGQIRDRRRSGAGEVGDLVRGTRDRSQRVQLGVVRLDVGSDHEAERRTLSGRVRTRDERASGGGERRERSGSGAGEVGQGVRRGGESGDRVQLGVVRLDVGPDHEAERRTLSGRVGVVDEGAAGRGEDGQRRGAGAGEVGQTIRGRSEAGERGQLGVVRLDIRSDHEAQRRALSGRVGVVDEGAAGRRECGKSRGAGAREVWERVRRAREPAQGVQLGVVRLDVGSDHEAERRTLSGRVGVVDESAAGRGERRKRRGA